MFPEYLNRFNNRISGRCLVEFLGKRNFKLSFLNVSLEKNDNGRTSLRRIGFE